MNWLRSFFLLGLLGCQGGRSSVTPSWEEERAARAETGLPGAFNLQGPALHVTGDLQAATVAAPFEVLSTKSFPTDGHYFYVPDAQVVGQGNGFVAVEAPDAGTPGLLSALSGSLAALPLTRATAEADVRLHPKIESGKSKPSVTFPAGWEDADRALFFTDYVSAPLQSLAVTGQTRATLIGTSAADLPGTVTLNAPGFFQSSGSTLKLGSVDLSAEAFAVGGDISSGTVTLEGRDPLSSPRAIVGHRAAIDLQPGSLSAAQGVRITQVLTADGYQLRAQVELESSEHAVTVPVNSQKWVKLRFREKTYQGDAVLKDVQVTGSGAALVQVPVRKPPTHLQTLWDIAQSSGQPWADAFIAVPVVLASPAIAMIDFFLALICAFTVCPEQHPYPLWMDAGQIGDFYIKVLGGGTAGTYDAAVTLIGHNYDPVAFSVRITVE